jgi:tight adherence protein C
MRVRRQRRQHFEKMVRTFGDRVTRADDTKRKSVRLQLLRAGYRHPDAVSLYFGLRAVLAIGLPAALVVLSPLSSEPAPRILLGLIGVGLLGWLLPKLFIVRRARRRQRSVQKALPDTLDLLTTCVEAGLGLNQALVRVAEDVLPLSRDMSDELTITNLEIRAGSSRSEALRNLSARTGLSDVSSLTAMLVQTDRFGTSIAQALRVHADTMRDKRRQRAEEAAAKTTIKLLFPLVLFVFPAIFVVILGPAVFHMAEIFGSVQQS